MLRRGKGTRGQVHVPPMDAEPAVAVRAGVRGDCIKLYMGQSIGREQRAGSGRGKPTPWETLRFGDAVRRSLIAALIFSLNRAGLCRSP